MNKPKALFISFNRKLTSYVGMAFGIAFLNLITIGLYKPYGLTKVRRALYNNITVGADSLEYTGDAASLSRVTFYPSLAVLFAMIVPGVLSFMFESWTPIIVINVAQLFLIAAAYYYLGFRQRQYELSQIGWRGQSFTLMGSGGSNMGRAFGLQLANLLTFGLISPWRRVQLAQREFGQLYHGRTPMTCTLEVAPLLPLYLLGWLGSMAGLVVACLYAWNEALAPAWHLYNGGAVDLSAAPAMDASMFGGGEMGAADPQALAELGVYMNALFVPFMVYPVWVVWRMLCLCPYEARWWQELADSLALGNLSVRFEGNALGLFVLNAISFSFNFMLANLTRPFTTYFRIRYFCTHLLVREKVA